MPTNSFVYVDKPTETKLMNMQCDGGSGTTGRVSCWTGTLWLCRFVMSRHSYTSRKFYGRNQNDTENGEETAKRWNNYMETEEAPLPMAPGTVHTRTYGTPLEPMDWSEIFAKLWSIFFSKSVKFNNIFT